MPRIKAGTVIPCRRILGIDPGLASCGWGIVELSGGRLRHITHGCILTNKDDSLGDRLSLIHKTILGIIKTYKPDEAAMENLFFGKNVSSALLVAEAKGVIHLTINSQKLEVKEFTPNAIKKAVVGVTRADKKQIQEMVRLLLGLKEIPKPDHAADALGAAIAAAHGGFIFQ